jgi:hypothetical protein
VLIDETLGDLCYELSSQLRIKSGYGEREDRRTKPWGFEYRTPPASIWSHPEVALTFLRAIEWITQRFLFFNENPLEHPAWPTVRATAEKATEFVKKHGGRLHWGGLEGLHRGG